MSHSLFYNNNLTDAASLSLELSLSLSLSLFLSSAHSLISSCFLYYLIFLHGVSFVSPPSKPLCQFSTLDLSRPSPRRPGFSLTLRTAQHHQVEAHKEDPHDSIMALEQVTPPPPQSLDPSTRSALDLFDLETRLS